MECRCMKGLLLIGLLLLPIVVKSQGSLVEEIEKKDTLGGRKVRMLWGGQLKLVGIYDLNALQDNESFNILSIPTGDNINTSNRFSMDVAQSRLNAGISYYSQTFGEVKSYFEGDFWGAGSLGFRMRFFYVNIKNFTFGQTWSVFCDEDAWADIVDFDGPPTGLWARSAQLRYTHHFSASSKIAFAVESPHPEFTTITEIDSTITENFQAFPDLTAHWNKRGDWGHFQISAIYRRFKYLKNNETLSNPAGGISLSGHLNFRDKDKLILQGTYGSGISSYMVSFMGGGFDAITTGQGQLKNLLIYGGYAAYELWLKKNLKTVWLYGHTQITAENDLLPSDNFYGHYFSATALWFLDKNLTFGLEAVHGRVDNFYNEKGDGTRLQAMFVFNF